jgi:hypothetical protein
MLNISRMNLLGIGVLVIAVGGGCSVGEREVGGDTSGVSPPRTDARGSSEDSATIQASAEKACSEASITFPEEGIPYSESMSLTAAYSTDAGSMAVMDARLTEAAGIRVTSPWEDRKPETALMLCYFDGELGPSRGPYDPDRPDYSRIVVVLEEGVRPFLATAGFDDVTEVVDPNDF